MYVDMENSSVEWMIISNVIFLLFGIENLLPIYGFLTLYREKVPNTRENLKTYLQKAPEFQIKN